MRQCLFCSSRANSLEDAWPRWITDQFEGRAPLSVEAERMGVPLRSWSVRRPTLTVRAVCNSCNNGWMSDLENQVKSLLEPLVHGRLGLLSLERQSVLALWATKTAMVLEGLDAPEYRGYAQHERESLRTVSAIPRRTAIWLAASATEPIFLSTKTRHKANENDGDVIGISTTMMFGLVGLQVLTIKVPETVTPQVSVAAKARNGAWSDLTAQIWPVMHNSVEWPPRALLNGEPQINLFADRFSTTGLSEESLCKVSV